MPSIEDPDPDAAVIAAAALARRHHATMLRLALVRTTIADEQRTEAEWGAAMAGRIEAIVVTSRPVTTPAGVAARADAVALACKLAEDEEIDPDLVVFLAVALARNLRSLIRQANAS